MLVKDSRYSQILDIKHQKIQDIHTESRYKCLSVPSELMWSVTIFSGTYIL